MNERTNLIAQPIPNKGNAVDSALQICDVSELPCTKRYEICRSRENLVNPKAFSSVSLTTVALNLLDI